MKNVFVNHTNHSSAKWSEPQLAAARKFGEIVDLPFPAIDANASREQVLELVELQLSAILELSPSAVLCQGEYVYTCAMVERLKSIGIPVMAACSERVTSERVTVDGATERISTFRFVQFRL